MTETNKMTIEEANAAYACLVGEYVWWVRCTDHRILQMEFGDPYLRVEGPWVITDTANERTRAAMGRRIVLPTGRWSLFVEGGLWNVEALDLVCSRSGSTQEEAELCLSRLNGQRLVSAKIASEQSTLELEFDLGGTLIVSINPEAAENDQWTLFQRDAPTIGYQSNEHIEAE